MPTTTSCRNVVTWRRSRPRGTRCAPRAVAQLGLGPSSATRPVSSTYARSQSANASDRVLLDEQHRDALLLVQAHEELRELLDDERREPERELVDGEQARLGHQRAPDRDHLLLAAGRLSGWPLAQLAQLRQQRVDAFEPLADSAPSPEVAERRARRSRG